MYIRSGPLRSLFAGLLAGMLATSAAAASLVLEAGTGRVVNLPGGAANLFVADSKIADARPANPGTLFVFGIGPGRTTVAALNDVGAVLASYDVTVEPSSYASGQASAAIGQALGGQHVRVHAQGTGLVLSGTVATPADAATAVSLARGYVASPDQVQNQLSIGTEVQVNLRVRIAEMSRSVSRALGVNWQALGSIGRFTVNLATANPLGIAEAATTLVTGYRGAVNVNNIIDALAQDNLVHVLAEPNLTAISGEPASFLVGGEFPIPVSQVNGAISVEFKQYGISLGFVPTVLANGRISLHVRPEVSQLSNQGAVQITSGNSTLSIPALTVRRAETTVVLGSGQSFAIAGLLQDSSSIGASAIPGLGEIPVLGALFRSSAFQRSETELVILVTPFVVQPAPAEQMRLPTEGWRPPSDLERILLLRQSARGETAVATRIPGDAGFVLR